MKSSGCAPIAGVTVSNGTTAVKTDANGLFSLPASGPKSYILAANGTGVFALKQNSSVVPGQPSPAKIITSASGIIEGTVTQHASVLPGAKVTLTGGALRQTLSVTTASNGSFSFGTVATGSYKITVYPVGSSASWNATVNSGAITYMNMELP